MALTYTHTLLHRWSYRPVLSLVSGKLRGHALLSLQYHFPPPTLYGATSELKYSPLQRWILMGGFFSYRRRAGDSFDSSDSLGSISYIVTDLLLLHVPVIGIHQSPETTASHIGNYFRIRRSIALVSTSSSPILGCRLRRRLFTVVDSTGRTPRRLRDRSPAFRSYVHYKGGRLPNLPAFNGGEVRFSAKYAR